MEKAEEKLGLITKYFSDFSAQQLDQLAQMEPLYLEWNSKINVISRKDDAMLYQNHVLHSLAIAAAFNLHKGMKILDIGTGGGFPGIPLAVFFPDTEFFLVDSIGKKIKVVEAVAGALGLRNLTARHLRAEEIKGQKFDTVLSRAVAPLGELWRWSKPLLTPKARFAAADADETPVPHGLICLKGGDLAAEISESGCRPRTLPISRIFSEPYFAEKSILYVPLAGGR